MKAEIKTHKLPAELRHEDCETLFAFLQTARGLPVVLDCDAVARANGLGLQMIAAAAKSWSKQGCDFSVSQPSPAFRDAAALLGLDHVIFSGRTDA